MEGCVGPKAARSFHTTRLYRGCVKSPLAVRDVRSMSSVLFERRADAGAHYSSSEEDEEGTLQRRAFPIDDDDGDAIAHVDEMAPPGDGLEYLRRVRHEQRKMPAVVTATVDQTRLQRASGGAQPTPGSMGAHALGSTLAAIAAAAPPPPRLPHEQQPSASWQRELIDSFSALRAHLQAKARASIAQQVSVATPSTAPTAALPDPADAQGWETWCLGCGKSGKARDPSVSLLLRLDQRRTAGLLYGLQLSLQRDTTPLEDITVDASTPHVGGEAAPSDALCRWVYSALARLDNDLMDADACATVRSIYVTCCTLRARLHARRVEYEPTLWQRRMASLNILLTLTGGFFQQAPKEEWLGV